MEDESLDRVDAVSESLSQTNRLLASSRSPAEVDELLAAIGTLTPEELAQFDWRARSWQSGLDWKAVKQLRRPLLRGAQRTLWQVLAFSSVDGFERERAIVDSPLESVLHVRLLVIRCLDWVDPVRNAALDRLADIGEALIAEVFALAERLATERVRGQALDAWLEARVSDGLLRILGASSDVPTRRAALRRLERRGALTSSDLDSLVSDRDVVVRGLASRHLMSVREADRRPLAEALIGDPVGWIGKRALDALVGLDGDDVVVQSLTAPTAPVRRAALEWAQRRDIDAGGIYRERLADRPLDKIALLGLAQNGDAADRSTFAEMLADPRARVAAAGLRALARIDAPAARTTALAVLQNRPAGRLAVAATDVLRGQTPSIAEADALAALALDPERSDGQRFRALSLLLPLKWLHLAVLLELRADAQDRSTSRSLDSEIAVWLRMSSHIARRPTGAVADRLELLLPSLDEGRRTRIEFVLRTSET